MHPADCSIPAKALRLDGECAGDMARKPRQGAASVILSEARRRQARRHRGLSPARARASPPPRDRGRVASGWRTGPASFARARVEEPTEPVSAHRFQTIRPRARGWAFCSIWNKLPVARSSLSVYSADMTKRGTIADITRWAEQSLPGEESRARSVIVGCRKADLFTKGGHGRNAPFMKLTDFPTAILAILHPGQVTQVHHAVAAYYILPLTMVEIDDPERSGPSQFLPEHLDGNELIRPYFDRFNLPLTGSTNVIGVLTCLFMEYAPHHDFDGTDFVEIQTAGDKVAVRIVLHGGPSHTIDGYPGSGPDNSALTLIFGDRMVSSARVVKTSRAIGADALNSLSLMAPNVTKAKTD